MIISGLIFDFDGTIIDTEYPEYSVWQEIFRSYDAEFNLYEWAKSLGTTSSEFDPIFHLQQRSKRPVRPSEVYQERDKKVLQLIEQQPLLPGIMDYLKAAKRKGLKVSIASSSGGDWVKGHIERFNLMHYFDAIVTADDVNKVKPEPDLFLLALNRMGTNPEETIVFEDSPNGIRAAKKANLTCVAIPNQISKHLDLSQADMVINSLDELSLEELVLTVHRQNQIKSAH